MDEYLKVLSIVELENQVLMMNSLTLLSSNKKDYSVTCTVQKNKDGTISAIKARKVIQYFNKN